MPDDFCAWLNTRIKNDIGAALGDEVLGHLCKAYTEDRALYLRAKEVLKTRGVWKEVNAAVRRRVHALNNVTPINGEDAESIRVNNIFPDAPVHPLAVVPHGWVLQQSTNNGKPALLKRETRKGEGSDTTVERPITPDPIVITSWLSNLSADRKMLEVAWMGGGKWRYRVVDREYLRDANKIIGALAAHGFDITSSNRRDIVDYLAAYEARNKSYIPVKDVSEQMGWQADGGFLLGDKTIGGTTSFHGADAGDKSIAKSIHSRGTLEGWRDAVAIAAEFPRVEIGIYAALATPLLELLQAPSFAIDWSGCSSQGKTTTLCVAASVWAQPDERGRGLITSWETTDVGIERRAATTNGLPLLIDETKRAKRISGQSIVPQVVYSVTNGQGKMRGSRTGLQEVRYWRTILLTTGEASIVDMSNDGGLVARVLTIWGSPFEGDDPRVPKLGLELGQHYGHAGPLFVRWLAKSREKHLHEWQQRYCELCDIYVARLRAAEGEAVARIASYLAVLELCAELTHPLLELPWDYRSPISLLADEFARRSRSIDRAREAMERICSWIMSNRSRFWSASRNTAQESPAHGWLGRWDEDNFSRWDAVYLFPSLLEDELYRSRYDARAVIRIWDDRGWIKSQKGIRARANFGPTEGSPPWFIAIRRTCIDEMAEHLAGKVEPENGELF